MQYFVKSILAGMAISIGGIAYLSSENSVIGAFLFSIGLIMIYLFDWYLYTGKACYFVENRNIPIILGAFFGNLLSTVSIGYLLRVTKLAKLIPKAEYIVSAKLENTPFSGFIMAIFCGILMYVAVVGYKTVQGDFGRYIVLIMPVVIFTISGFEHVVANMFYFSIANAWSFENAVYILIVGVGNLVGCSIIPLSNKLLIHKEHV